MTGMTFWSPSGELLRWGGAVREDEVFVHDDPQGPAGAHGDGRLHVEVPLDEALAGTVGGRLRRELQSADEIVVAGAEREFAPHSEHGGERHALQELPGVEIDLIGEAG